jgi:hypothetical protein
MSNVNGPNGFRVAMSARGGSANRRARYHIAGAYASDIYTGDAVIPTGTSKQINRPGAGNVMLQGIFDGCYYLDPNQSWPQYSRHWPAAQAIVTGSTVDAWVYDDPDTIFEAQASNAFTAAGIGSLADLVIGTGNAYTRTSGDAIDSTTIDGSGSVFKIMDTPNRPDNVVGQYSRLLVKISKHYLGGAATGI